MERLTEYADGRLLLRRDGPVAAVTFNQPARLNAMSLGMWQALGDVAGELASDDGLRIVTLRGAGGRAFVSGADISEFGEKRSDPAVTEHYNATVARAEAALGALPVPTLALIEGYCIGGGMGIAMRCDLRIAAENARFAVTAAKIGLGYGFASLAALHHKIGPSVTADLLFTGRKMPAGEALAKGICDRVVAVDDLEAEGAAAVAEIAANAPLTLRAIKAGLIALRNRPDAGAAEGVDAAVARCFASNDYKEGQAAFAEKRKPVFRGD